MIKKILITSLLLSVLAIASPASGQEKTGRFQIYIINEVQRSLPKSLPAHFSPFLNNTVIKLDTLTGKTWVLCEIHYQPKKSEKSIAFLEWCSTEGMAEIEHMERLEETEQK